MRIYQSKSKLIDLLIGKRQVQSAALNKEKQNLI
jgi:hypothetical protein